MIFAAGEVLGTLCRTVGSEVYASNKDTILSGIRDNLERKPLAEQDEETQRNAAVLAEKLSNTEPPKVSLALSPKTTLILSFNYHSSSQFKQLSRLSRLENRKFVLTDMLVHNAVTYCTSTGRS